MALIPRDVDHPYDDDDPMERIMFLQHGVAIPTSDDLIDRTGAVNPFVLSANGIPYPTDRRISMLTPDAVLNPDVIEGNLRLPTPDFIPNPDRVFARTNVAGSELPVPYPTKAGALTVEVWGFVDLAGSSTSWFPGTTMRCKEGELVHSTLMPKKGTHTIHHHGIEPTAMNDGVGHSTFEVAGGGYTYQFLAPEAGTYFYHCHKNTVLHFELGMYGMFISDPNVQGAPFLDGGPGAVYRGNTIRNYDKEAFWVFDDIDSRWHETVLNDHGVGAGVGGNGAGAEFTTIGENNGVALHRFDPDFFLVSGVFADPNSPQRANLISDASVSPVVNRGQVLLIRALNASYTVVTLKFPSQIDPEVIAMDGRTFGRAPFMTYSSPFRLSNQSRQLTFSTASRWDLLIDTSSVPSGTHLVEAEFRHWRTNDLLRRVYMQIVVNS
ncbi:MAG: hypothetical protein A2X80_14145 [Geobacteraceae bacterium GWB2_52_12]|nr:MAG: hypothetical protein A2X80_14145 [Geobacteraceae bacterium GWB2_52_12]